MHFKPEEIVGKQVVVVANLAPRKMRGIESNGMILMAEDKEGKLYFVSPEDKINPGAYCNINATDKHIFMNQKIGFIGLGNLGTPIALNLIDSGHTLYVYNRTASKAAPLAAKGAIVCDSIASLAKQCNIVFTIVSDDAALKDISEGENGLLNHLRKESIHISMSTILPQTAAELAIASPATCATLSCVTGFRKTGSSSRKETKLYHKRR